MGVWLGWHQQTSISRFADGLVLINQGVRFLLSYIKGTYH